MRTNSASDSVASVRGRGASNAHEIGDPRRMARQQQDAVGEIDRLFEVVRDQHRGRAGLDEDALQLLAHEQRHLVVERRERLVEEQDFRLDDQRAHDRDELLLAAGHLVGVAVEVDLDAEMRDQLLDPRVAARPWARFISLSG